MVQDEFVTPEMRENLGRWEQVGSGRVDKRDFQRWAAAVGDLNPLYFDESFAHAHGHPDVTMPAGFIEQVIGGVTFLDTLRPDGTTGVAGFHVPGLERRVHGGEDTYYYRPAYPDDVLTLRRRMTDIVEKRGRSGAFVRMTWELEYRNQASELVTRSLDSTIAR